MLKMKIWRHLNILTFPLRESNKLRWVDPEESNFVFVRVSLWAAKLIVLSLATFKSVSSLKMVRGTWDLERLRVSSKQVFPRQPLSDPRDWPHTLVECGFILSGVTGPGGETTFSWLSFTSDTLDSALWLKNLLSAASSFSAWEPETLSRCQWWPRSDVRCYLQSRVSSWPGRPGRSRPAWWGSGPTHSPPWWPRSGAPGLRETG